MVNYFVPGKPIAQPRHKVALRGGRAIAYIDKKHPIHGWKELIIFYTQKQNFKMFDCAIQISLLFCMPRLKSHFNKSGLKKTAPSAHIVKPDIDNLQKGVFDALIKAGAIKDDSLICNVSCSKVYDNNPGVCVILKEL